MTEQERLIYNNGERLIPGVTHDAAEVTRHKSSYEFFKHEILSDKHNGHPISILDLGCGVGWGCKLLSEIPNSNVLGLDIDANSIQYAQQNYSASNISYLNLSLTSPIIRDLYYDYIVSRGVFEHLDNPLPILHQLKYKRKLIFDVPYKEFAGGNSFHKWTDIYENTFRDFPEARFYFESMSGFISNQNNLFKPNMIMVVLDSPYKQEDDKIEENKDALANHLGYAPRSN
jgi:cyclopropane fatty-acyl-phospholipid synthase-like methyltransferase